LRISRLKLILLMGMSLFGLWASSMVVVVYYLLKQPLPLCTPGNSFFNCDIVLSSGYSQVFGVPLELFAVVYFVVNVALVFLIAFGREGIFSISLDVLFVWRFIGLMLVPYLVFVELFLLKAVCIYCTMMHVAIVADFVVISYFLFFRKGGLFEGGEEEEPSVPPLEAGAPRGQQPAASLPSACLSPWPLRTKA
jgi:uncharacterized membrane protein